MTTASLRCPDGHVTQATDYCDVCGLPMSLSAMPPDGPASAAARPGSGGPPAPQGEKDCPNCGIVVPASDLFCENCGYDFTTGQLPVEPAAMAQPGYGTGYHQPGPPAVFGPSGPTVQPPPANPGPVHPARPVAGPPESGPVTAVAPLVWVAELWIDPDWFATQDSDEGCPSAGMPIIVPLWERSLLIGRVSVSRNIHPQIDCGTDHGVSRRHAQLTSDGQRWWVEDLQSSNGTFVGIAGAQLPTVPIPAGQRIEFAAGDRIYVGAWSRIVVRKATPEET